MGIKALNAKTTLLITKYLRLRSGKAPINLGGVTVFLKKFFKKDKNKGAYGEISTSIFTYITPLMCFLLALVTGLVIFGHKVLWQYFETNYALNGLIIFTLVFTMARILIYNVGIYHSACFLKDLDQDSKKGPIDEKMITRFQVDLEKRGKIFNTSQMSQVIDRILTAGSFYFTDTDARLIKSKTGFRISGARAGIGFMAGILVMLGLLGTFLGLLKTIDAVGEAMGAMGNIGGGDVDENMMGSFIGSLAAPLQGMGLAFSSSLFGLSGSLLIGFFNYLSGFVHDGYIENFSRWVDDRIPQFDPKSAGKKAQTAPKSDDLRTWLMGFVHLANENNKNMSSLFLALAELTKQSARVAEKVEYIGHDYVALSETMSRMNDNIAHLQQANQAGLQNLSGSVQGISSGFSSLTSSTEAMRTDLSTIGSYLQQQGEQSGQITHAVQALAQNIELQTQASTQALEKLSGGMSEQSIILNALHDTQKSTLTTIATHLPKGETNDAHSQEQLHVLKSIQASLELSAAQAQAPAPQQQTSPLTATSAEITSPETKADFSGVSKHLEQFAENLKTPTEHDVYDILSQSDHSNDSNDEDNKDQCVRIMTV